jgi:hypothetical protein
MTKEQKDLTKRLRQYQKSLVSKGQFSQSVHFYLYTIEGPYSKEQKDYSFKEGIDFLRKQGL